MVSVSWSIIIKDLMKEIGNVITNMGKGFKNFQTVVRIKVITLMENPKVWADIHGQTDNFIKGNG
jgi:hypothetical protein